MVHYSVGDGTITVVLLKWRAGEKGAYPSEVEAKNLASRDSTGRERRKGGRWGKHERGGRGTYKVGGGSAAAAGGDGIRAKAAEGIAPVKGCYRCGKQGHMRANCTEKLCSRCNGRGHTADVCPMSKEEAVPPHGQVIAQSCRTHN